MISVKNNKYILYQLNNVYSSNFINILIYSSRKKIISIHLHDINDAINDTSNITQSIVIDNIFVSFMCNRQFN